MQFKTGSLEETLFIPLIVRAKETTLKNCCFMDDLAVKVLNNLVLNNEKLKGSKISDHGIIVRTIIMDRLVTDFIDQNPNGIVINLGAGLDTRQFRLNSRKVQWYNVDLQDVINFRREILGGDEDNLIEGSVLDSKWTEKIAYSGQRVFIIAEGLLMYFSNHEVKHTLNILIEKFKGADMCFDVLNSFFVGKSISSTFKWGIKNKQEIMQLDERLELLDYWSTGDYLKKRQGFLLNILNIMPNTRNRSGIVYVRLGGR